MMIVSNNFEAPSFHQRWIFIELNKDMNGLMHTCVFILLYMCFMECTNTPTIALVNKEQYNLYTKIIQATNIN